eukprot:GHVS01103871.1.p1 GENE.GHVS01103871.1~~GHVS01103871.1.p1  ORF type:complete len:160 (+),score=35.98 GHVS01103871.1:87-566(+)
MISPEGNHLQGEEEGEEKMRKKKLEEEEEDAFNMCTNDWEEKKKERDTPTDKPKDKPKDLLAPPDACFRPGECLSFAEALCMYTRAAAYAGCCGEDETVTDIHRVKLGEIRVGFGADFTILDRDVSVNSFKTLLQAKVTHTWVAGRLVHENLFSLCEYL